MHFEIFKALNCWTQQGKGLDEKAMKCGYVSCFIILSFMSKNVLEQAAKLLFAWSQYCLT